MKPYFFADDTSIYPSHTTDNLMIVENSLQKELDAIYKYGQDNIGL